MKKLLMIVNVAVAVGAMALPTMAGATLTVSQSGSGFSVSVPAGALDADSGLYLVWDTEDHGDELAAWPSANRVAYSGALSESAATYTQPTSSLPESYCARVIAAKAVNVIDGYILLGKNAAGNSTRCINTQISAKNVYGIAIKYRLPGTQTGSNTSVALLSGSKDDGTIAEWSSKLYLRWHHIDNGFVFPDAYTSRDIHEIVVGNGKAYIDGVEKKSGTQNEISTASMGTVDKTVLLSARWDGTTINCFMHAEWYYARLYGANGSALRDLVPALTNNSVAVFYDKVSHKYFGNSNSDLGYSGTAAVTNFTLAASASLTSIATATWTGGGETASLDVAGNWTPGLPGAFSTATINGTGETPAVVPDAAIAYAKLNVGVGGNGELVQSQGAITASAINGVVVGSGADGVGRYTMTGGTLTTTYSGSGDDPMSVGTGSGGTGYFEVSGDAYASPRKLNFGTGNNAKGYLTVSGNGVVNCRGDINVGTWHSGDNCYGEVNQSGGIVTATNAWVKIPFAGTGKYTMTGGKFIVKGQVHIGYDNTSHGTITQSDGETVITEDLIIGGSASSYSKGVGDFTLSGGSVTVDRYAHIGAYGTGTFTQSGGSVTFNNWTAIGRYSGGNGTYTVTGGTITVPITCNIAVGQEGTGTFDVGGDAVVNCPRSLGISTGSGGQGTLILRDNAKIVTKTITKGASGTTTPNVTFNGGTIQATEDNATFLNNLGNIQLGAGGLTIDTQGHNLGITNCTFNVSSSSGKITVTGGGTVTFTDVTIVVSGSTSGKVTFAERTDNGVFAGVPTSTKRKIEVSGDSKAIRLAPYGFIITVF